MLVSAGDAQAQIATLTVSPNSTATVPADFVGMSWEWGNIQKVLGKSSTGTDHIAHQLIDNLAAPSSVLIRVGGFSSDAVNTPQNIEPLLEMANDMNRSAVNVRFMLGFNMRTASVDQQKNQAQAYWSKMPPQFLDSLEVGNEPNGYGGAFLPEIYRSKASSSLATLHSMIPGVPFSGPSCSAWVGERFMCDGPTFKNGFDFDSFIRQQKQYGLKTVTAHYYYKKAGECAVDCLLEPGAYQASTLFAPYVKPIHKLGMKFRLNEFNSVYGGGQAGVSDAFGSALWFIANAMSLAAEGLDGVNVHGNYLIAPDGGKYSNYDPFFISVIPGTPNRFVLDRVTPIYYGMLFVKIATQNNRELHPVSVATRQPCSNRAQTNCIQAWETVDTRGIARLVVLNLDQRIAGNVRVSNPNTIASVCYLSAPSYGSTINVSFAGQTFDGSTTGKILGTPSYTVLRAHNGGFDIPLGVTRAAIVLLGASGGC
jgi:hypothetical protein